MNIVLTGMSGCGKTTVAQVFKSSGKTVADTDCLIEKRHGKISEIFARSGERYFRDLETRAVKEVSALDGVVIATGGGCVLRAENVELLKANGKIFYLRARTDTLIKRLEGDTARPLLQGGVRDRIIKLYYERAQIYENSADYVIDTDELTPEETANKITELII